MRARDYFPLGVAGGQAFCNREEETRLLLENIQHGKHSLLMAARRYGKSSLALHAIALSGLAYTEIDFYMASSEKVVENYILNGVIDSIGKALGSVDKLVVSIKRYVKNLKPKLDIGTSVARLELVADEASDPATNVKEALLLLEELLKEKNKQAVLLMDEFQNVGVIAKGSGIEAAIRHVAQKTKNLSIIFSGSNRKLLKTMFEDDTRPLYKLCWKLSLKRISAEYYRKHLKKAAVESWGADLDEAVFTEIMLQTERHPFYVNKLCDRLWTYYAKKIPSVKEVQKTWLEIIEEEKSDAVKEISALSLGQKNVLLQVAKGQGFLTGKHSVIELHMSSSSILVALAGLEEKDVIEREGGCYQVINPVIKYYALKSAT